MTPQKEKALKTLISCRSQEEAAAKLGVMPQTIMRYLADPIFAERYKNLKESVIASIMGDLKGSIGDALKVLSEIMLDKDMPEEVRVDAAKTVLDAGIQIYLNDD